MIEGIPKEAKNIFWVNNKQAIITKIKTHLTTDHCSETIMKQNMRKSEQEKVPLTVEAQTGADTRKSRERKQMLV